MDENGANEANSGYKHVFFALRCMDVAFIRTATNILEDTNESERFSLSMILCFNHRPCKSHYMNSLHILCCSEQWPISRF